MAEKGDQEKTERATEKRREEAREKGQIAQSREIPSVLVLLTALCVFFFAGAYMIQGISDVMRFVFQNIGSFDLREGSAFALLLRILQRTFIMLMPLMLIILIAGIGGNLLQNGYLFTWQPLSPKLSKLDPVKGIGRLVSARSLVELVKSVVKVFFVGGIAFVLIKGELRAIPSLMQMGVSDILSFIGMVSLKICFYTCLALIVLAALDYAFQRWQYEKDLKMTKQEVKEELKQREGDPSVKARIRSIQREMAKRRMMESVPEADVIITNPTNLAIALKYDAEEMAAPRVIAKGAGFVAERIREIAKENGVPIVENKPLAQTLYKVVEIDEHIPVDLYRAVAEVLAYVYRLKGMHAGS